MQHTGTVVVGVGVGAETENGRELDWAAREAQLRDRPLHLMRAFHLTEATVPWESAFDRTMTDQLHRKAEQVLDAARSRVAEEYSGVQIESFAVDGPAARVLREASEDAELTAAGSRQPNAVGTAVLGSVRHGGRCGRLGAGGGRPRAGRRPG